MSNKPEVTFVNTMTVSGFLNGNINLAFTTARWTARFDPEQQQAVVVPDEYESCFLRMDLHCATQVRDALDRIIKDQTKAPSGAIN